MRPSAETLARILAEGFPLADCTVYRIESASPDRVVVLRTIAPVDLRPGHIVSGPVLMDLADMIAWLHAMARHGESARASVTTDCTMHFLAPARGDVRAVCTHDASTRSRDRFTVRLTTDDGDVALAHVGYAVRHDAAG